MTASAALQRSRLLIALPRASGDFSGYFCRAFDARSQAGPLPIISGEIESGKVGPRLLDGSKEIGVAQSVLRNGVGIDLHGGKASRAANCEDWCDFTMNQCAYLLGSQIDGLRIGDSTDEAGQECVMCWRPPGK